MLSSDRVVRTSVPTDVRIVVQAAVSQLLARFYQKSVTGMSTLKKNKRIKRAAQFELYGDRKPGNGVKKCERGKAKYLGGNGRKTTGITLRKFRKNLKRVRVLEDGVPVRRRVPVSLIRSGLIVKPVAADPFALPKAN